MTKDTFYAEAHLFLQYLNEQMARTKVSLPRHWAIDHICYRAETEASYQKWRHLFADFGELLIESEVNGRMIATFKLFEPLSFLGRSIYLVELPAPKPHKPVKEGFEHVEVVTDRSFGELRDAYPCHFFDEAGLNKSFNQELEMGFTDCAVKFHHLSLESVIRLEKNEKVFSALKNSKVLERFRDFDPKVVGTFPLGIQQENSDLDILLCVKDFSELTDDDWQKHELNGEESWVTNFTFEGVAFELFAQKVPTHHQVAFRHFLVEERILSLGGENFKNKILALRQKGMKTEPAFAAALGLEGNAYQELLKLQVLSDAELRDLLGKANQKG